jgi:hypothetical protein
MDQVLAVLRRSAARVRAGFVLGLLGQGLRLYSSGLPGALPAPVALAGTIGLVLSVIMVWTGLESFMSATTQGFMASNGESSTEDDDAA